MMSTPGDFDQLKLGVCRPCPSSVRFSLLKPPHEYACAHSLQLPSFVVPGDTVLEDPWCLSSLPASDKSSLLRIFAVGCSWLHTHRDTHPVWGQCHLHLSFMYGASFGEGLHFCTMLRPTKGINLIDLRQRRWWLWSFKSGRERWGLCRPLKPGLF